MNPDTDKHPAVIAQCKSEEDVLRCVGFAHENELEVAVRSGNHSFLGWGTCNNGIVIDLSKMKGVKVAPDKRTAQVSTGNTGEEILASTSRYGLAPVLGECGSVGAGLALGGGLGWLSGKFGAASDNLLSARLITAEGHILNVDRNTNSDLFWAIRGGGGNFGIATSFEYQLHPVKEVLGGSYVYPIGQARAILRFFREFMANAPDDLQAECYLSTRRGGTCRVELVYAGKLDQGEQLLSTFRKHSVPLQDWVKRRAFSETYHMSAEDEGLCLFESDKGSYIKELSDEVIDVILDRSERPLPACEVVFNLSHYMHGEVCRVPPDATAFGLRSAEAINLVSWVGWKNPADASTCLAWHNETFLLLQPYSGGRIYSDYMSTTGESATKSVFGANYNRLVELKKKYDPQNFFHLNQNIIPR